MMKQIDEEDQGSVYEHTCSMEKERQISNNNKKIIKSFLKHSTQVYGKKDQQDRLVAPNEFMNEVQNGFVTDRLTSANQQNPGS